MAQSNRLLKTLAFGFGLLVLSSCTQNFCTVEDTARVMFAYDGVGTGSGETYQPSLPTQTIIETANAQGIAVPSDAFFEQIDIRLLAAARLQSGDNTSSDETILDAYGYLKFYGVSSGNPTLWVNYTTWTNELKLTLGLEETPDNDFLTLYKSEITKKTSAYRACIAIQDGSYGPENNYSFSGISWGEAFNYGLIEGLLVYPVAWLVETFATFFTVNLLLAEGWGQVLAIFLTTLIVRSLLLAATFKSTLATQKMSLLQPELTKLQQKYPNSNTNNYERQHLAQEQMALYQKNGINPFGSLMVAFFQFPVFIAVWGAMTGSAILSTGSWLGLNLNASVGDRITSGGYFTSVGWWTATVLFLLMSAAQFVSMKLPLWLVEKQQKNVSKTMKSPAAEQAQSQTKLMSNIMLIMIIFMGFSLPSAMGIYWFFGALMSVGQTLITRKAMAVKK